ncbi:MAG: hypothetical protein M3276_11055 [Actinomycetota bacterium]|nr:hypothetical protein [Actinomycetota bacterium]
MKGSQRSLVYERVPLGDEARRYVGGQILEGGLTMSRLLLEKLRPGEGTVFTYLPPGVNPGRARDFDHGGVASLSSSERAVVQFLRNEVDARGRRLFVVENPVARCTDPLVGDARDVFCYGDEVYHWTQCSPGRRNDVLGALRRASSGWMLVGMLTSLPSALGEPRLALARCEHATLAAMTERTELVVASAYDGEGHVIWDMSPPGHGS